MHDIFLEQFFSRKWQQGSFECLEFWQQHKWRFLHSYTLTITALQSKKGGRENFTNLLSHFENHSFLRIGDNTLASHSYLCQSFIMCLWKKKEQRRWKRTVYIPRLQRRLRWATILGKWYSWFTLWAGEYNYSSKSSTVTFRWSSLIYKEWKLSVIFDSRFMEVIDFTED